MSRQIVLTSIILGVLVFSGCDNDGTAAVVTAAPDTVQMSLSANLEEVETHQTLRFTLAVAAPESVNQTRIDFESDGVWDEIRSHGTTNHMNTFEHSYPSAGSWTAVAEVSFFDQTAEVMATTLTVVDPSPRTVEFVVWAEASHEDGVCYAVGWPYTDGLGTSESLGSSFISERKKLDVFDRGSTALLSQDFRQDAYGFSGLTFDYSCTAGVRLYVGNSLIRQGSCVTSPGDGECTVRFHVVVP